MGCRTVIVLDTHAWIWFVDQPSLLGEKALRAAKRAAENSTLLISSISCWEILMLESKGRLELDIPAAIWIERCEKTELFQFFPVDNVICRHSMELDLPGDPADRFIAATAHYYGAALVTKDRRIRALKQVKTIW